MITKEDFDDIAIRAAKLRKLGEVTLDGYRIYSITPGEIMVEVMPASAWYVGSYQVYTHEDFESAQKFMGSICIITTMLALERHK